MSNLNPTLTFNGNPGASARRFRGWTAAEAAFAFTQSPISTIESSSAGGQATTNDALYDTVTGATVLTEARVAASQVAAYSSLDPAIATVDAGGKVSRVANGTARIVARTARAAKVLSVPVSRATGQSTQTFNSFVAGSLAKHCSDAIDSRLAGKTPSTGTKRMFSSINWSTLTFVRNPSCALAGIDVSCLSPGNPYNALQGCTLVSEDLVAYAAHFPIPNGTTIYFVGMDNTVVSRTLLDSQTLSIGGNPSDFRLGRLSTPITSGITPAKVLPANWKSYLPSINFDGNVSGQVAPTVPVLYFDRESKALVREFWKNIATAGGPVLNYCQQPVNATRLGFYETGEGGDSNGSMHLVVNLALVFLGILAECSTSPQDYLTSLNALGVTLGSSYPIQTVSLTGFNTY